MMSKLNNLDKMVQALCEQRFGSKVIRASYWSYADKNWSFSILQMICGRVDEMSSAAAAGKHFEQSEWAADIRQRNVRSVDDWYVQSLIRYSWIFNAQLHLKNTLKCKLLCPLNHSMKFAGCVLWILTYKVWKSGSNTYYHCWYTEVSLRDCFVLAHPVGSLQAWCLPVIQPTM